MLIFLIAKVQQFGERTKKKRKNIQDKYFLPIRLGVFPADFVVFLADFADSRRFSRY